MAPSPDRSPTKGSLLTWTDVPDEDEDAFNEWYNREHVRDRVLGVPGFRRGRRFTAVDPGPRYLAVYDVETVGVLSSPAYMALVGTPDAKSRHFMTRFLNTTRTVSQISVNLGEGEGACLGLLEFSPQEGHEPALRDRLASEIMPTALACPGVIAGQLLEVDPDAGRVSASAHTRRKDRVLDWTLLLDGADEGALAAVRNTALSDSALVAAGAGRVGAFTRFRLIYRVSR